MGVTLRIVMTDNHDSVDVETEMNFSWTRQPDREQVKGCMANVYDRVFPTPNKE